MIFYKLVEKQRVPSVVRAVTFKKDLLVVNRGRNLVPEALPLLVQAGAIKLLCTMKIKTIAWVARALPVKREIVEAPLVNLSLRIGRFQVTSIRFLV